MQGFNVDALSNWWQLNMSGATKPYWVLHRSAGGRPGPTIANYGTEDKDASWVALVEMIQNSISQGVTEFWVVGRPGGVNDTKGKVEYQLRANGYNGPAMAGMYQQQGGGIYGMGYPSAPPAPAVDIAGITAQIEEKYKLQNQLELQSIQHKHQMEKMEEMIEGIAKSKQTGWERFLEMLENPEIAQGVIGMVKTVQGLLSPQPIMQPNIGNVAPPTRKRKPQVVEQPATVASIYPDTDGTEEETDEESPDVYEFQPIEGLENEYDAALEAVNLLHEMQLENPGIKLLSIAKFIKANPVKAMGIMSQIQSES